MKFVIMLYRDLAAHPNDWPIRKHADTIEALRKATQCSGGPELAAQTLYRMEHLEEKSLIDTQTGNVETGAIYQCTPKG